MQKRSHLEISWTVKCIVICKHRYINTHTNIPSKTPQSKTLNISKVLNASLLSRFIRPFNFSPPHFAAIACQSIKSNPIFMFYSFSFRVDSHVLLQHYFYFDIFLFQSHIIWVKINAHYYESFTGDSLDDDEWWRERLEPHT